MSSTFKASVKTLHSSVPPYDSLVLKDFFCGFKEWIDSLCESAESKWSIISPKRSIIESVQLINLLSSKDPQSVGQFYPYLLDIFARLLNTSNDQEIRSESWLTAINVITSCSSFIQFEIWSPIFSAAFSLQDQKSDRSRVKVGAKAAMSGEQIIAQCAEITKKVDPSEDLPTFFFWWCIISNYILPFFLDSSQVDKRCKQEVCLLFLQHLCLSLRSGPSTFGPVPLPSKNLYKETSLSINTAKLIMVLEHKESPAHDFLPRSCRLVLKFLKRTFPSSLSLVSSQFFPSVSEFLQYYSSEVYSAFSLAVSLPEHKTALLIEEMGRDSPQVVFAFIFTACFNILTPIIHCIEEQSEHHLQRVSQLFVHMLRTRMILSECLKYGDPGTYVDIFSSLLFANEDRATTPVLLCLYLTAFFDGKISDSKTMQSHALKIASITSKQQLESLTSKMLQKFASQLSVTLSLLILDVKKGNKSAISEISASPCEFEKQLKARVTPALNDLGPFLSISGKHWKKKEAEAFVTSFLSAYTKCLGEEILVSFSDSLICVLEAIGDSSYCETFLSTFILDSLLEFVEKSSIRSTFIVTSKVVNICTKIDVTQAEIWVSSILKKLFSIDVDAFQDSFRVSLQYSLSNHPLSLSLLPFISIVLSRQDFGSFEGNDVTLLMTFLVNSCLISRSMKDIDIQKYSRYAGDINIPRETVTPKTIRRESVRAAAKLLKQRPEFATKMEGFVSGLFFDCILNDDGELDKEVFKLVVDFLTAQKDQVSNDFYFTLFQSMPQYFRKIETKVPEFVGILQPIAFDAMMDPSIKPKPFRILARFHTDCLLEMNPSDKLFSNVCGFWALHFSNEEDAWKSEIQAEEFDFLMANFRKKCGNVDMARNQDLIVVSKAGLQICASFPEKMAKLAVSSEFGSSLYTISLNRPFGSVINSSSEGSIPNIVDRMASKPPLLLLIESCISSYCAGAGASPAYVSLARNFCDRSRKRKCETAAVFIPIGCNDLSAALKTKWEETSKQFQEFIKSFGEQNDKFFVRKTRREVMEIRASPMIVGEDFSRNFERSIVVIAWNETGKEMGIGEFNWRDDFVLIEIAPMKNGLYRVGLIRKNAEIPVGPICNRQIVPRNDLTFLVCLTIETVNTWMKDTKALQDACLSNFRSSWSLLLGE